ncbi:MAG: T6SS immunity protein Tdi1 domain-containing protein [Planctomycetota bacterium]
MFEQRYRLTDSRCELPSSFEEFADLARIPSVGVYSSGLLSVVDSAVAESLLRDWAWLINQRCRALMTTAFGDVFFWDPAAGVQFLDVQAVQVIFACKTIGGFLDNFLQTMTVRKSFLRRRQFEDLARLKGPLKYHNAFILVPWRILGGVEVPRNYEVGSCAVYLSLVGQTLKEKGMCGGPGDCEDKGTDHVIK